MHCCSFRFFPLCFPSARASNNSWALCNLFHTTSPFPLKTFQPPNQTFHPPCPCCHLLCYSHLSGRRAKKSFAKKSFNFFSFCIQRICRPVFSPAACISLKTFAMEKIVKHDCLFATDGPFHMIWFFCKKMSLATVPFVLFGSFAKTIVVGNHPLCNRPAFSYDLDLLQKKLSLATVFFTTDRPFPMICFFAKQIVICNRPLCNTLALSYDLDLLQKKIVDTNCPSCERPALPVELDLLRKKIGWQPSSLQKTCPFVWPGSFAKTDSCWE